MKKRLISSIMACMFAVIALVGVNSQITSAKSSNTVELVFWHAMSGNLGVALNKMIQDFNDTHKDIKVTAQFQGSYDDALNKLKSAQLGNNGPDIMQVYDIGTRYMIDSKSIVPIQNFIDKEKYDISSLEPNLLGYYSVDNKLYSMPFNSSTPILFYNKTAFKAAGLDPNNPPKTFTEVEQMAKKLTKKDSSGKVTQYGFSMAIYGWYFEQLLVKQNMDLANNGNGRKGRATEVVFDKNGAGLKIMSEWKKLVDSGYVANYGRNTGDTQNAFVAGNTAMFINSTASLGAVLKAVNGKFQVGTAFLPKISSSDKGGVSIGGASLWIMDKKDVEKQNAAWEFVKFMVSPDQQAFWNKSTGYFPVTKKAYTTKVAIDNFKQYPQFWTAVYQLHNSPVESRGALLGVFPEARAAVESNIEDMIHGKLTPQEAVNNSAKTINAAIAKYNETNK